MNHESYWEMDRNARRFAAATLMPPDEVVAAARRHFPGIIDYLGYAGPGSVMAALSMALGQEFRVSAEAMRYRLRNWPLRIEDRVERALGQAAHASGVMLSRSRARRPPGRAPQPQLTDSAGDPESQP
jgi:hypothetical protein